jgi:hypothetical protein
LSFESNSWIELLAHKYSVDLRKELKIACISTLIRAYQVRWFIYLGKVENFCILRLFYEYESKRKGDLGYSWMQ